MSNYNWLNFGEERKSGLLLVRSMNLYMEFCQEFSVKLSQYFSGKIGIWAGVWAVGWLGRWMVVVGWLGGWAVGCSSSFTLFEV